MSEKLLELNFSVSLGFHSGVFYALLFSLFCRLLCLLSSFFLILELDWVNVYELKTFVLSMALECISVFKSCDER